MKHTQTEPLLAKLIRFGIYLLAFMPLIIVKDYISPFHFGKVLFFRSLVEILSVGYIALILKDRSYLPKYTKVFWAFLGFTLAFSLTTLTSALPYVSFWSSLERMGGLWTFWHYFVFFVILTSTFTKKEHWHTLLDVSIFVGVLSAFYGFGQKTSIKFFIGSGNRERIFGTIGNAALFAGYELFIVFLSLIRYLEFPKDQLRKILYGSAFAASSLAVAMTAVRGSLLGYVVGMTVFAFLWARYKRSRIGKLISLSLIGAGALFIIFALLFNQTAFVKNSKYLSRVTSLSFTSTTVQTRVWAWQAGLKGWSEGPKTVLLGWGPENFNLPFSKNFNPKFFVGNGSETLFDRAHNMFIEVLVTMGVVGFAAYIGLFVVLFMTLYQALKKADSALYAAGLIAAIIAYMIHNAFIFDTAPNFLLFFMIAWLASYLSLDPKRESNHQPLVKSEALVYVIATILGVGAIILIYTTAVLPARANYAVTRAILYGRANNFDNAAAKFKEAVSYDVPGKYEYRHKLAQYLVGVGGPSFREAKVADLYAFAIAEIDKNIAENPGDNFPYLYGSRLHILLGTDDPKSPHNDQALVYSFKALELSPEFIRTYYEIAQAYLNKKDYPKALAYFQKAVDLNPATGLSYWYLGSAKLESGDINGIKDLEKAVTGEYRYSPTEQEYLKLVDIYLKRKDFARIAVIYEKIIAKNPKNPQYYASLATAYANIGRIDDAVATARKAVLVDPSFEPDARTFIQSLGRKY